MRLKMPEVVYRPKTPELRRIELLEEQEALTAQTERLESGIARLKRCRETHPGSR